MPRHKGSQNKVTTEVKDNYDPFGVLSVDWISTGWAIKEGRSLKQESYDPDTFRFFK